MNFSVVDATALLDEVVKTVLKVLPVESSQNVKNAEVVVCAVNNDGTVSVRPVSSPDEPSQYIVLPGYTCPGASVGQRLWVNYTGDYTNAYISPSVRVFQNIVIPHLDSENNPRFVADVGDENEPYIYSATIPVEGLSANSVVYAAFDHSSVSAFIFAPTCESIENGLIVRAIKAPDADAHILTLISIQSK